jgi:hypothetical protein
MFTKQDAHGIEDTHYMFYTNKQQNSTIQIFKHNE